MGSLSVAKKGGWVVEEASVQFAYDITIIRAIVTKVQLPWLETNRSHDDCSMKRTCVRDGKWTRIIYTRWGMGSEH